MAKAISLAESINRFEAAAERIENASRELKLLEDQHRIFGRLAAVALGQLPHNPSRVNFSRFVLGAKLDEVLEHASRRLYAISRGQFRLRRSQGTDGDRRRASGLDLEVEDIFSGTCRATPSLSGGEGFMASLCLALGLADVVQSDLGGVRLETVFVDEGFGTLDSETLELALKTLIELQAGGRVVGVISHVADLREQIPQRICVRKSPLGSTAAWERNEWPSLNATIFSREEKIRNT
jgi:exonuclease SbcC